MKVRRFCLFFFSIFVLFSTKMYAQEFAAKGVVLDKITKNRVVLAEITNRRTGVTVGSNDMGFFQISALMGDTLIVQKRNYAPQNVGVAGKLDIVVNLVPDFISIDGVTIKGQTKQGTLDEMKQDYKNKGSYYGGKPPFLAFFLKPLTALYEVFGRTPKNARRFGKFYVTEMQQTQIDGLFNATSVQQHTGLSGKELEDFMVKYRPDFKDAEKWNTYDAIKYIKTSYKGYTDTLGVKKY